MDVGAIIDRYIDAKDAYFKAAAEITVELAGKYGDEVMGAAVAKEMREKHLDLHVELMNATKEHEKVFARLRHREVEAHERATAWATINEPS